MITNKKSILHLWNMLGYFRQLSGGVWIETDYQIIKREVRG